MAKTINIRKEADQEILRLLEHWRQVERSIKRAEQISGKAVIPAINELRYASRQLFTASQILRKDGALGDGDQSILRKRITIAEQYLLNADHDAIDGPVTHYRRYIDRLNKEFGVAAITKHFHKYPDICDQVSECEALIDETRLYYDKRKENYDKIRGNHIETLVSAYREFENAEIDALFEKAELERQIVVKQKVITTIKRSGVSGKTARRMPI